MSIAEKLQTIAENEQKVYEAGKQAEYDAFWDAYQSNGTIGYCPYMYAGRGWRAGTFKPKYDIRPTSGATGLFRESYIFNLRAILLSCGVTLDLSGCTGDFSSSFAYSKFTVLPKLDFSSAQKLTSTFSAATNLTEIEEIVVHEDLDYSAPFYKCTSLEQLIVTGTIGQNGFDVSACTLLSHDSLMSIINALKDGVSSLTVTLGEDNLAKLTDAEKATATEKGWTLL